MRHSAATLLLLPTLLVTAAFTIYPWSGPKNAQLGQPAVVNGVIIQVAEVLQDTRCPENEDCASPGYVRVRAYYLHPKQQDEEEIELVVGTPTKVAEGAVTVEAVRPAKRLKKPIEIGEYRFDLRFDPDR